MQSIRGFSGLVDNHGQSNAEIRSSQDEEYLASLRADQEKVIYSTHSPAIVIIKPVLHVFFTFDGTFDWYHL